MSTSPTTSDQPIGDARVRVLWNFCPCRLSSYILVPSGLCCQQHSLWLSSLTGISFVFINQEGANCTQAWLSACDAAPPLGKTALAHPLVRHPVGLTASSSIARLQRQHCRSGGLGTTSDLIISTIGLCCLGLAVYRVSWLATTRCGWCVPVLCFLVTSHFLSSIQ